MYLLPSDSCITNIASCLHSRLLVIRANAVQGVAACDALNRCLDSLAADYTSVKFCRIRASEARLSINFVRLLVLCSG